MTPGGVGVLRTLGILGAGQLSRMLAEAARHLGLRTVVLAKSATDSAALVADHWVDSAQELLRECDRLIFENEFVDVPELRKLEQRAPGQASKFFPDLDRIEELQDKLKQKERLARIGVPTSPWRVAPQDPRLVVDWLKSLKPDLSGWVLKGATLGYDGKGTWIRGTEASALAFCQREMARGIQIFAEERVPFVRELAIIATAVGAGPSCEVKCFPVVVSEQQNGICRWVYGPARLFGLRPEQEEQAVLAAERLATTTGLRGTFAIELFERTDGSLCVNEIAPRVHNTGHFSIDVQGPGGASQFENHVRAAMGMPLGSTTAADGGFVMLNILGPETVGASPSSGQEKRAAPFESAPAYLPGVATHWYQKSEIRPGRKLGHLTVALASANLESALELVRPDLLRWEQEVIRNYG